MLKNETAAGGVDMVVVGPGLSLEQETARLVQVLAAGKRKG
jgi:hypothetical protein